MRRLLLIALTGCTTSLYETSTAEQGACVALEGRTFSSVTELECGRTPAGYGREIPAAGYGRCHWQLTFATGDTATSDVTWHYSDVIEAGQATCRDLTITATLGTRTIVATFDPSTQRLTWAGESYVAP